MPARPLTPPDRDRFLPDVTAELECYREIGPGIVARVVRETQHKVFAPPILGSKAVGKYGR